MEIKDGEVAKMENKKRHNPIKLVRLLNANIVNTKYIKAIIVNNVDISYLPYNALTIDSDATSTTMS